MSYYTVYDNNTDSIIIAGTAEKCTNYLGIKISSFFYSVSRQKRVHSKHKYTIFVEKMTSLTENNER